MAVEAAFTWSPEAAPTRYQAPEAFLCLLSLAAAADGNVAAIESEWLQMLTRRWWARGVLREKDVEALNYAVCARLDRGADEALAEAAAALPVECRLSAYAQALDLMLINGPLNSREAAFADALAAALLLKAEDMDRLRVCVDLKNKF